MTLPPFLTLLRNRMNKLKSVNVPFGSLTVMLKLDNVLVHLRYPLGTLRKAYSISGPRVPLSDRA